MEIISIRELFSLYTLIFVSICSQFLGGAASLGINSYLLRRGLRKSHIVFPVSKGYFILFYISFLLSTDHSNLAQLIVMFHVVHRLLEECYSRTMNFSGYMSILHFLFAILYYIVILPEMTNFTPHSFITLTEVLVIFSLLAHQSLLHVTLFSAKQVHNYGVQKPKSHYYLEFLFYILLSRHLKQPLASFNVVWLVGMIRCS